MTDPLIKGDEVRRGAFIYLGALSNALIESLSDDLLSGAILHYLDDASRPVFPTSAKAVAQATKATDAMNFALCLQSDDRCVGVCSLADVSWTARHAVLKIQIIDESQLTVEMLVDVIQTVLQFVYWEANLNRIAVHCLTDQSLLQEALEQMTFVYEGQLRQDGYRHGNYIDKAVYSMLHRDWMKD